MEWQAFSDLLATNVLRLRAGLRAGAEKILSHLPDHTSSFSGEAFVESVGTLVSFERGMGEFFYEPTAFAMRDKSLKRTSGREAFFNAVAKQCPVTSRVLNIGAGGDLAPILAFREIGHEIISTDMAADTIQELIARGGGPAFACDLAYVNSVLPAPVDFVIGNSVLGYLNPAKLIPVVENVIASMSHGGVFSFDLSPHPKYLLAVDEKKEVQTCVNEGDADPTKLLELIRTYGAVHGMGAMAYHVHYRAESLNLAIVQLLREAFEQRGVRCTTGVLPLLGPNGVNMPWPTLRVSRTFDAILQPVGGEILYEHPDEFIKARLTSRAHPYFVMWAIDRGSGEELARALGIHRSARTDPCLGRR